MRSNQRRIAAAMALAFAVAGVTRAEAGGGLFGKKPNGQENGGQAQPSAPHDHVHQASVEGSEIPEGTVVSVTPIYPPGEEPGKASFDGTRADARPAHAASSVTGEPAPIGVVRTNYNHSASSPAPRMPGPVDVMAHGRSAAGPQAGMMPPGMMPPGMMPPGMMPPGQAPGLGMKPPRRGILGRIVHARPSAKDPYAVFHMSKSQRAAHAAIPMGPQMQGPVSSLPASAVYGGPGAAPHN